MQAYEGRKRRMMSKAIGDTDPNELRHPSRSGLCCNVGAAAALRQFAMSRGVRTALVPWAAGNSGADSGSRSDRGFDASRPVRGGQRPAAGAGGHASTSVFELPPCWRPW
jgi:hypothetical protein